MKLFGGVLTLIMALIISGVAGFFSVIGLGHLFAGAFWPVVIMGTALETGKIIASTWLKAHWHDATVGWLHKLYLMLAVMVLMAITALGVYGYLAKGHLEQEAPLAAVELQIKGIDAQIAQAEAERTRLEARLAGLDQAVNTLLSNAKTAKESQAADRARQAQRKDRADLAKQIAAKNAEINGLGQSLVPLKLKVSDVSAKLGPVKYVAQLFGWQDPNTAVQLVIVMIMFAFDPLALVLVLSGTMTIGAWMRERAATRVAAERQKVLAATDMEGIASTHDFVFPHRVEGRGSRVETLPKGEDLGPLPDLDYFNRKLEEAAARQDEEKIALEARVEKAMAFEANAMTSMADTVTAMMGMEAELVRAQAANEASQATIDRLMEEATRNLDERLELALDKRKLEAQVDTLSASLEQASARPIQTVVPAVYGTVMPTGQGPVMPTASLGAQPWTAAVSGLDGNRVTIETARYPFLKTLVEAPSEEKLTNTTAITDTDPVFETFNSFAEHVLKSDTK